MVGKREEEEEEEVVTREITEWRCGTIGFFLLVCFDRGITSEIQMTRGRGIAKTWKNRWTNVEGRGRRKAR